MVGSHALELHGELGDLQLEVVDQPEADVDVAPPRVGDLKAAEQPRPGSPNKSETGQGCPKVISVAWMRFFSAVR
jgi:hypothetical protein